MHFDLVIPSVMFLMPEGWAHTSISSGYSCFPRDSLLSGTLTPDKVGLGADDLVMGL